MACPTIPTYNTAPTAKLLDSRASLTINIDCHPATFKKWWAEVQANWITCSAAKYVNEPRRAFGVYVIDAADDLNDCVRAIWQAVPYSWRAAR